MSNDLSKKLTLEDALQQTNSALTIADFNNVSVGDYILTKSDYDPIVQVSNIEVNEHNDKKFLNFYPKEFLITRRTKSATPVKNFGLPRLSEKRYF